MHHDEGGVRLGAHKCMKDMIKWMTALLVKDW